MFIWGFPADLNWFQLKGGGGKQARGQAGQVWVAGHLSRWYLQIHVCLAVSGGSVCVLGRWVGGCFGERFNRKLKCHKESFLFLFCWWLAMFTVTVGGITEPDHGPMPHVLFEWFWLYTGRGSTTTWLLLVLWLSCKKHYREAVVVCKSLN